MAFGPEPIRDDETIYPVPDKYMTGGKIDLEKCEIDWKRYELLSTGLLGVDVDVG
jgi:hypothetical protein